MQHLYVLRRVSSWSFRLSVSMALLLSGAGLAASLLAHTTLERTQLPQPLWKSTLALPQVVSALGAEHPATTQVIPVSLSGMAPAYSFAASATYSPPLPSLLSGRPDTQAEGFEVDFLPTASTVKVTVQRSWNTFKLAFR